MSSSEINSDVRILTLNCWGLKFVSRKREQRIAAIANRLRNPSNSYDIIALQEVWVEQDYKLLRDSVKSYLPFAKRWYSGILTGPGLVVFSRWPIDSAWIFRFPLNGRPSAFWRGDWYVGKAAGSCVICHPSGKKLEIVNAHLHAPYASSGDASYTCHRASQAWDLSGLVRRAELSGHAVFLTGDLNARPQSIGMRLLEHKGGLSDAWLDTSKLSREFSSAEIGQMTPQEQIHLAGVTSDSQLNSWRKNFGPERAKRLDYIFYDTSAASVVSSKVTFTEPEPGVGSLSDHFGFSAIFTLNPHPVSVNSKLLDLELENIYTELLKIISAYRPTWMYQSLWRLTHFWASTLLVVGLIVSIWWGAAHNRPYVGFVYIIVAVVASVTGVVNGLIGFLFGNNESRALSEFEEQVHLALSRLRQRDPSSSVSSLGGL